MEQDVQLFSSLAACFREPEVCPRRCDKRCSCPEEAGLAFQISLGGIDEVSISDIVSLMWASDRYCRPSLEPGRSCDLRFYYAGDYLYDVIGVPAQTDRLGSEAHGRGLADDCIADRPDRGAIGGEPDQAESHLSPFGALRLGCSSQDTDQKKVEAQKAHANQVQRATTEASQQEP